MRFSPRALIPCKNFPKGKIHQDQWRTTQAQNRPIESMIRMMIFIQYAIGYDWYNYESTLGVPVYKGLWDTSRMSSSQHHDEATTKQVSTKYGLSSIRHESMCHDERISLQRCGTQISVVDTMCSNRVANSCVVNMTSQRVAQTPKCLTK